MSDDKERLMLVILDGWGKGEVNSSDAIAHAATPCYDGLIQNYPNSNLVTYGGQVGLPDGQMGNSEVGHLNIGAGRIVYQELARINKAIDDGTLMNERAVADAIDYAKTNNKKVHLLCLLSDGGVHSHIDHLIHIVEGLNSAGIEEAKIHAFMDGRDTAPKGGEKYMELLMSSIAGTSACVATMIGRYYAMDRDRRWERTRRAYDLLVNGIGQESSDPRQAIRDSYDEGVTDEFIEPHLFDGDGKIESGDVVFFVNFRTDRPRQLVTVLTQQDMPDYEMSTLPLHFLTMTEYDKTYDGVDVVYKKDSLKNTLGEVISKVGKSQVRIAETEKYPHVTFFFSGGREEPFAGEERILLPSPNVATYDQKPEMSAYEVTQAIIEKIEADQPDFICLNYANTDMVGHTGDWDAAIIAAETVDTCLSNLLATAAAYSYHAIIIADHGNADYMVNEDGTPNTAHTTNLVPIIYVPAPGIGNHSLNDGKLADVAPTILHILGIDIPQEMTGEILRDKA